MKRQHNIHALLHGIFFSNLKCFLRVINFGEPVPIQTSPENHMYHNDPQPGKHADTICDHLSEGLQDIHLTPINSKILTQSVHIPTLCDVTHKAGCFVTAASQVYPSPLPSVTLSSCLRNNQLKPTDYVMHQQV